MPARLGHDFRNPALLIEALTHPSLNASGPVRDYERLEFLGDRVLGLVVAHMLLDAFPDEREGDLAKRHAALVRKETLARVAREADIAADIRLSAGEEQGGTRESDSILSDVCEAVIGALYLDGGLSVAGAFIKAHWQALIAENVSPPRDFKSALQERVQAKGLARPVYTITRQGGSAHAPSFTVCAEVAGYKAYGTSGTRRSAEQAAAESLLQQLSKDGAA